MMKRLLALLLGLLLLPLAAYGYSSEEARAHNADLAARWVNWYPSGWSVEPAARPELEEILTELEGADDLPLALHDWICEAVFFDRDALDAGIYSTLSPSQVLRERRGVCEAIANLAQALFVEAGIPCIKVRGVAIPEGESWESTDIDPSRINHTWNEFYAGGRWVTMDCSMDMGNEYSRGQFLPGAVSHTFFDPDPANFAENHLILERSADWPENIPDHWAKEELGWAADSGRIPPSAFRDYRSPISAGELLPLLDLPSDVNPEPVSRLEAAHMAAGWLGSPEGAPADPYEDTNGLAPEDRALLALLCQKGILRGDGTRFRPGDPLTRQEALIIISRIYGGN